MSYGRVVTFAVFGVLLTCAVVAVGFSMWQPSLPDVPTPAEALERERAAEEQARAVRESAFWGPIRTRKYADLLRLELEAQEAARKSQPH